MDSKSLQEQLTNSQHQLAAALKQVRDLEKTNDVLRATISAYKIQADQLRTECFEKSQMAQELVNRVHKLDELVHTCSVKLMNALDKGKNNNEG